MILLPDRFDSWRPKSWKDLGKEDWAEIAQKVQAFKVPPLVLLGTGKQMEDYEAAMKKAGGGGVSGQWRLEAEPTDGACATYNMLTDDGRDVVGAFIASG